MEIPKRKNKIHNYYEIFILDKNNNVKLEGYGFNTSYVDNYLANSSIYYLTAMGLGGKYIEPISSEEDNITDHWVRINTPSFSGTGYKCTVLFLSTGRKGTITSVRLSGKSIMSEANLQDIEGTPLVLNYEPEDSVRINAYIYFAFSGAIDYYTKKLEAAKNGHQQDDKNDYYGFKYFQADCSIMCGCSGREAHLLKTGTYYHNGDKNTGYLPIASNYQLAISKAPLPLVGDWGFYEGGINSYQIISPNIGKTYKNATNGNCWKGLIRSIVVPGVGAIDLLVGNKLGVLNKGILPGSEQVPVQSPCYIPEEYLSVKNPDGTSLISITKNAFYYAKATVIRFFNRDVPLSPREIPMGTSFFSPLIEDKQLRRCLSFSQPVPLTNKYCGAEGIIPCDSGSFVGETERYYGYDIIYSGEQIDGTFVNLAANYAVTGEVLVENSESQQRKVVFPYKIEYSFDGNIFETAFEFTSASTPYAAHYFSKTIIAPIWRISCNLKNRAMNGGIIGGASFMTTHSDKYISELVGDEANGYDPLFIFIGLDDNNLPATGENGEGLLDFIPYFRYDENMGSELGKRIDLKVPYLYHENDCYYITGSLINEAPDENIEEGTWSTGEIPYD